SGEAHCVATGGRHDYNAGAPVASRSPPFDSCRTAPRGPAITMSVKPLPISAAQLAQIADERPTPFYVYDERSIRRNARALRAAFDWCEGFREYFAVKATPNPHLLAILAEEGCGADCSSLPE